MGSVRSQNPDQRRTYKDGSRPSKLSSYWGEQPREQCRQSSQTCYPYLRLHRQCYRCSDLINDVHIKMAHALANSRRTGVNSLASSAVRVLKPVILPFDCIDNAIGVQI